MSDRIIFISYSHDSDDHRNWVAALSERLRKDGFETRLDQYLNGTPDERWPRWMLNRLDEATHVLVVCTETYYRRFRGHEVPGLGKGVDWEGALITQELYDSRSWSKKFVPVLRASGDAPFIPEPVRGATHYVLDSEARYQALLRFLAGSAGIEPGPLGSLQVPPRTTVPPMSFSAGDREYALAASESDQRSGQPAGHETERAFHEGLIARIVTILGRSHSQPLKVALSRELGLSDEASSVVGVAESWWNRNDGISRLEVLRTATDWALARVHERDPVTRTHPLWLSALEVMGHTVKAAMSAAWLERAKQAQQPYRNWPVEKLGTIEICSACLDDRHAELRKPGTGSMLVGGKLVHFDWREMKLADSAESPSLAERGWPVGETVDEVTRVVWKSTFYETKSDKFSAVDYGTLSAIIRGKKQYLAFDGASDQNNPVLLPPVRDLLCEKLAGVRVHYFGRMFFEGQDEPLVIAEGELLGQIWLFLELMEKYVSS